MNVGRKRCPRQLLLNFGAQGELKIVYEDEIAQVKQGPPSVLRFLAVRRLKSKVRSQIAEVKPHRG